MSHYAIQTFYSFLKIQLVKKLYPLHTFIHQLISQPQEYPVGRSLHNHTVSFCLPSFAASVVTSFKAQTFLNGQDNRPDPRMPSYSNPKVKRNQKRL